MKNGRSLRFILTPPPARGSPRQDSLGVSRSRGSSRVTGTGWQNRCGAFGSDRLDWVTAIAPGRAAVHADKILRGVQFADVPVEQAFQFEMVINLKAASGSALRFQCRSSCAPTRWSSDRLWPHLVYRPRTKLPFAPNR